MRDIGKRKNGKIKEILLSYMKNNKKEYLIVTIIFLVGVILGVVFVNKTEQVQLTEISNYFTDFINNLKNNTQIDNGTLLKESMFSNLVLAVSLWFIGSTVIGIPIIFAIVVYRGFCLGYTISSCLITLGLGKRNSLFISSCITTKYNFHSIYISIIC